MATVLFEEQLEIPADIRSLADFRRWARSDVFPEQGRIDFINGRIEVDMAPEDLFTHGTPKSEIAVVIGQRVKRRRIGYVFIDRARISCPAADLSVEPDLVFISYDAVSSGKVRLVRKASRKAGRYIEIEGPPELVVEIVSDSSTAKDTRRLPAAYFRAGVTEFWLVDARGDVPSLVIHRRGRRAYLPLRPDHEGFQASAVLGCRYRLDAARDRLGNWDFDLVEKPG